MSSENPTTALTKVVQSPTLARVSNQLALTDKLLSAKSIVPYDIDSICPHPIKPELPSEEEYNTLPKDEQERFLFLLKDYNHQLRTRHSYIKANNYITLKKLLSKLRKLLHMRSKRLGEASNDAIKQAFVQRIESLQNTLTRMRQKLTRDPFTNELLVKKGL